MTIETWDAQRASEDELRAAYAFNAAIERETDPDTPLEPYEMWHKNILEVSPFFESKRWVVRENEQFLAAGWLGLNRSDDNKHLARFNIEVRQDKRRSGLGRDILRRIIDGAEADGRTTLAAGAPKDSPGEQFLGACAMEHKLLDRRSRLVVSQVDLALVDSWIVDAKAKAADYSLVLFDGPIPDEMVQPLIDLDETMNDAPRDDLDMEDWHQTPDEFRDTERRMHERGTKFLWLVAQHDQTGELAGYTFLDWNPLLPQLVWQGGTAVRREHRGRALGRWLKAANFNLLRERNPQAEFIDTWNAGTNKWMLAINDDMGYRPYIWYSARDAKIDEIKKAIA